jgi:hypothetical protein
LFGGPAQKRVRRWKGEGLWGREGRRERREEQTQQRAAARQLHTRSALAAAGGCYNYRVSQHRVGGSDDLRAGRGIDVLSWGARLGMELPIWNRNRAGIAAAQAERQRTAAQEAARHRQRDQEYLHPRRTHRRQAGSCQTCARGQSVWARLVVNACVHVEA